MIAGCADVVARGAEPGHDQRIAALFQDLVDRRAAVERRLGFFGHYLLQSLKPTMRCEISSAPGRLVLKVSWAAAKVNSRTSFARSTRCTITPAFCSAGGVPCPIA